MTERRRGKLTEFEKAVVLRFLARLEEQTDKALDAYREKQRGSYTDTWKAAIDWWDQVRRVIAWARSQVDQ